MFSVEHLNTLRSAEIEKIIKHLRPADAHLLEVGAGTGQQARELSNRGFRVEAIEIPSSNYAQDRLFPILDFDGRHIPFPDSHFDVVFSSNVLEHVPDLVQMHNEIRRVLKPNGYALHILPTHAWRFWTTLSAFPTAVQYAGTIGDQLKPRRPFNYAEIKRLAGAWHPAGRHLLAPFGQQRHGERGNIISETWLFHPSWWRRNFAVNGFEIIKDEPMGLFYTGNMTFNTRWSLGRRAQLSRVLGSACHLFELRSRKAVTPAAPATKA
ncbi:class I SAM-dependent methyltransferase [Bradyrhizobium elkanii]|uniref:class I SAM-dependent methyltransferase n=1 Tax=Bradyrhizobium elkanii TaxID=29448 RepID=UPI000687B7D9|nr:class I SAM-dependent methyltransferase [Bradyrhizobium elkanii]WLA85822.1 methyltransferase domain-containing protein [Bradyrhizobium elkanii]